MNTGSSFSGWLTTRQSPNVGHGLRLVNSFWMHFFLLRFPASAAPSTSPSPGSFKLANRPNLLSEHVDYWNRLGWVDPFASTRFTGRQRAYAARFREASVYTPQMVVDGRVGFVGSDREQALRAIAEAARQPKAKVVLALGADHRGPSGNQVQISVFLEGHPGPRVAAPAEVFLAITESGLHAQVLRGENAGRRLEHTGVVRKLIELGHTEAKTGGFTAMPEVLLEPDWNREHLRVIVFVQVAGCGPVLGSAALSLAESGRGTKQPTAPL